MPSRTAHAPRGFPCDFTFFLAGFPKGKVKRILLYFADGDTCAGFQVVDILSGKLSVVFCLAGAEVDIPVGLIRVPFVDQSLDERDDVRNMLGNSRMNVGLRHVHRLNIFEILLNVLGLADNLIIHIGEVLHELYLIAAELKILAEGIKNDDRTCVSNVNVVIYRRSAGIDQCLTLVNRLEFFFLSGQCVIYFHL